uniref:Retinol dehydrogenase 12, like n=1 Tax=Sinocyclocheilus grahami TaxID=75366 RepID=A0A672M086_SINGR
MFCSWSSDARLDGKTVIITGANTGIGKETAIDLAKRGACIIMACRDIGKAHLKHLKDASGNQDVVTSRLDLADSKSIREFAENINKEEKQVNVLISNAGVNHMGHFLLTYLLLDLIKRSTPARIINVSSMAHQWGTINLEDINSEKNYDKQKAYSQSKLANILFTRSLAKRLEGVSF